MNSNCLGKLTKRNYKQMNQKRRSRSFRKKELFQVKALQFHSKKGDAQGDTTANIVQRTIGPFGCTQCI